MVSLYQSTINNDAYLDTDTDTDTVGYEFGCKYRYRITESDGYFSPH